MRDSLDSVQDLMQETYALVFKKNYSYDRDTLDYSQTLVAKDFKRLSINNRNDLKGLRAVNIGTGSEAIAIAQMGVDWVSHIDISQVAVKCLSRFILDNAVDNMSTALCDLCSSEGLSVIDKKCDIVYLNGVLHHLYNPQNALINIMNCLNDGGKLFIRTYRNESWLFFMTTLLRKLFKHTNINSLVCYCVSVANGKDIYEDLFICEMFDDMFVPVISIYSYKELMNYFTQIGFSVSIIEGHSPVENGLPYLETYDTDESVMFALTKTSSNKGGFEFPRAIDQLMNFANDDKINQLLLLWDKLDKHCTENSSVRKKVPQIIYDLYHFASFRRERPDDLSAIIDGATSYIMDIITNSEQN